MRLIFLAVFLIVNLLGAKHCNAQSTVIDSSFITNKNGVYYQNRVIIDELGNQQNTVSVIGDTTKLLTAIMAQLNEDLYNYNRIASQAIPLRKAISEKSRYFRSVGRVGAFILDSIAKKETNLYQSGFWKINDTGIRFRRTVNNWQWRSDTTTTWREMTFLGDIIRLNGLNGYTTDLYRTAKGSSRFRSLNSQFIFRPLSDNSSARNASAPIQEDEPVPSKTILVADGTVILDGKTYKYNSKGKAWKILK